MRTDGNRRDTQIALLYDLRLLFSRGEKEQYSREELTELLDKIADEKVQE